VLTGAWRLNGFNGDTEQSVLSCPLPLAQKLDSGDTHYVTSPTAECPGSAADPATNPPVDADNDGELCVYQGYLLGAPGTEVNGVINRVGELGGFGFAPGADTAGAIVTDEDGEVNAWVGGTWAVTGPPPPAP